MKKLILITLLASASFSSFADESRLGEHQKVTCEKINQSSEKEVALAAPVAADKQGSETVTKD